tara:strand:- start:229 stop:399 length:171 start_codon:yes stop_codon:yes gene_type:complete
MEPVKPYKFLKKGSGSLASNYHDNKDNSEKRKQQIIDEQEERERKYYEELEKNYKK